MLAGILINSATGWYFVVEAAVQVANEYESYVMSHAYRKESIMNALNAGVKSIEHGTYLDRETTALFKKHDAVLVPTVLAGMTVVDWAENYDFLPPASAKKALEVGPQMQDMMRIAHSNGVTIAFGTDSGVSKHGENAREFGYLVDGGMSEMQAIIDIGQ